MTKPRTLESLLSEYKGTGPGFHLLRHLLSVVILAHHCRVAVIGTNVAADYEKGAALTGGAIGALTRGQIVVELLRPGLYSLLGMFFALSGFLIMGSALRNRSIKIFFANRLLRIVPALSVEVTLSALVLGPFVTSSNLSTYFTDFQFFRYFGNIIGHITFSLPGVFLKNPWPDMVNANLWTLPAEFWCYALMLGLMITGLSLQGKRLTLVIVTTAVVILFLGFYDSQLFSIRHDATHYTVWYIIMMFFFGTLFYINADRVRIDFRLFAIAAVGYYVLTLLNQLGVLSGILLTYCVVYIGMQRFPVFDRLLKKDLSYGIYLYGFPITQAIVFMTMPYAAHWSTALWFAVVFPGVLVLTGLLSSLSWDWIEKPALGLRKHMLREPKVSRAV